MGPPVEPKAITQVPTHAAEVHAERNGTCLAELTAATKPLALGAQVLGQALGQPVRLHGEHTKHLPLLDRGELQALFTQAAHHLEVEELAKAKPQRCRRGGSRRGQHAAVLLSEKAGIGS
jgi:hypothetical protein